MENYSSFNSVAAYKRRVRANIEKRRHPKTEKKINRRRPLNSRSALNPSRQKNTENARRKEENASRAKPTRKRKANTNLNNPRTRLTSNTQTFNFPNNEYNAYENEKRLIKFNECTNLRCRALI